ncbi:MAG: hypothetical protein ABJA98_00750 [Acidobacteriota bacterium]
MNDTKPWQRKQRSFVAEAASTLESGTKTRESTVLQVVAQVTATYAMATTSNRLWTL